MSKKILKRSPIDLASSKGPIKIINFKIPLDFIRVLSYEYMANYFQIDC